MRKYFGCVPLWLSIAANAVLGYFELVLFLMGVFGIYGLFSAPAEEDIIHGYIFLACIPISIAAVHLTLFFICGKIRGNGNIPSGRRAALYTAANIAVFAAAAVLSMSRFW